MTELAAAFCCCPPGAGEPPWLRLRRQKLRLRLGQRPRTVADSWQSRKSPPDAAWNRPSLDHPLLSFPPPTFLSRLRFSRGVASRKLMQVNNTAFFLIFRRPPSLFFYLSEKVQLRCRRLSCWARLLIRMGSTPTRLLQTKAVTTKTRSSGSRFLARGAWLGCCCKCSKQCSGYQAVPDAPQEVRRYS